MRETVESVLFSYDPKQGFKFYDFFQPPSDTTFRELVTPEMIQQASKLGRPEGRHQRAACLGRHVPARGNGLMLYIGTPVNAEFLSKQHFAAEDVFDDYRALQGRARSLQLKFNLVLFAIALRSSVSRSGSRWRWPIGSSVRSANWSMPRDGSLAAT